MKFILTEDIDKEDITPEEVEEIKDSVKIELKEDLGYKNFYIEDSSVISEKLKNFLLDFEDEEYKFDFLDEYEFKVLHEAVEIMEDFHTSYRLYARKKWDEFRRNNPYRGL